MIAKSEVFIGIKDPATLGRLARASEIRVLNRFSFFEAINTRNGHRYRVDINGQDISCNCPDAKNHQCKHEIAVLRDLNLFKEVT
ncbi:SWIM zinc finger family protein [Candidatus Methanoperedens sp. BLZ2]|uniref:SWIM zinc finger family protein n=1 Tax=Candidatus Methanoperedens sp. BLZ2 TaxID=2035255 RepID=UPI000BE2C037|nr:SWIM zinc finger family protein [Candidatus Methanoperedens sp. BLZ2]MBZ0174449.1 SWIM zinc finger family protein [Candidatus Methanoperedens nitroreducens]